MITLTVDGKNVWTDELARALEITGWPEWDESGNVTHSIPRPDVFGFNGFHLLSQTVGYEERYSIPATTAYLHIKEHLSRWCRERGIFIAPAPHAMQGRIAYMVDRRNHEDGMEFLGTNGLFNGGTPIQFFPDELSALVAAVLAQEAD
jgi:hypothetical protein